MNRPIVRIGIVIFIIGAAIFLLIQFLPLGPQRTNPPVIAEPKWDSPETRALAKRACFDCHSNETVWPWYSYIAPVSWLLANDAQMGRRAFNFSEWKPGMMSAKMMEEQIRSGKMPLPQYLLMHPEARLTDAEKEKLIAGLHATLGAETKPPAVTPTTSEQALVQERCTGCHGLDRVTSVRKTRAEWAETVARMVSKGARLNAAEQNTVVEYLSKTYGR
jgi:mono/diheme cytochrome c family protein